MRANRFSEEGAYVDRICGEMERGGGGTKVTVANAWISPETCDTTAAFGLLSGAAHI